MLHVLGHCGQATSVSALISCEIPTHFLSAQWPLSGVLDGRQNRASQVHRCRWLVGVLKKLDRQLRLVPLGIQCQATQPCVEIFANAL